MTDVVASDGQATKMPDVQQLSLNQGSGDAAPSSTHSTPLNGQSQHASPGAAPSEEPAGPIRIPFAHPLPSCKPSTRPELTPDQSSKYHAVLTTVQDWKTLPTTTAKDAPTEPLSDGERMWLTRECLLRYLRATTWNTTNAVQRLQATLVWRREYGVDRFTADHISPEMETGKECILGYDVDARPCLYMNPGRQNTEKSERQIEAMCYMLERTIDMMDPGQETCALLINFKSATSSKSPSAGQGRQVLGILQGHYPERLGRACISDLPWYINTFFKLISPFIDPITKSKMVFNTPLREKHVPASQLWKDYGGDADFEYEHDKYWPALIKICNDRREAYTQRWIDAGSRIGEFENYLRGGDQKPLKHLTDDQTPADTS